MASMFPSNADDFIDDTSDHEFLDVPPVRRAAETSRHFSNARSERQPIELRNQMDGCDDYEKKNMEECYEKLVRLRNDVHLPFPSTNLDC
jgi:hypothetical protein